MVTVVVGNLIGLTLATGSYFTCVVFVTLLSPGIGLSAATLVIPALLWAQWCMPRIRTRTLVYREATSDVTSTIQETQLFSDSIGDNIRYGNPDATPEEVERVARIARFHDFIAALPDGYNTRLGSATSSKLSVGQKQRISIASGLLRDTRILILDEPTCALDSETEQHLVQSLHEAAKNRLVVIIAHRLSTIAHADKIIFLEDGKLHEQGNHDQLMAIEDGHYRRFVELQTSAAEQT